MCYYCLSYLSIRGSRAMYTKSTSTLSSHDRILSSAKQLFAQNGFENTSTVAIAREAGTSESQLMKHFGSKQGLLVAIFDRGWNSIGERIQAVHHSSPARTTVPRSGSDRRRTRTRSRDEDLDDAGSPAGAEGRYRRPAEPGRPPVPGSCSTASCRICGTKARSGRT